MAKIGTSETQFAFMFFHKFSNLYDDYFKNVFAPSTYQEGNLENLYRGTDIVIDQFFIQFKLPSYIIKFGNSLFEEYYEKAPYFSYEIYNRNNGRCGQYDFLKQHSQDPRKTVLYISPSFSGTLSTFSEEETFWFRDFYQSDPVNIDQYSCSINLVDLNWIWKDKVKHHISYRAEDSFAYAHSKTEKIKKSSLKGKAQLFTEKLKSPYIMLNQCIEELNNYLPKAILPDDKERYNIKKIQLQILCEYNVHWIPLIHHDSQEEVGNSMKKMNE